MTSDREEAFLARLYTDDVFLDEFLRDPAGCARCAGLPESSVAKLVQADPDRIRLAARSFARKRTKTSCHSPRCGTKKITRCGLIAQWVDFSI
jgi:hypothetical protein